MVSGSQTDAGSSANTIVSYTILDSFGSDVTLSFTDVVPVDGTLTVSPAALTITTGSASKKYDGAALTDETASVSGLADGEEITVTATGRQLAVGASENTFTVSWGSVNSANYTVSENPGTLTVTANDTPVKLTAVSFSMTYDGEAKSGFGGVTAEGFPAGVSVMADAQWSARDAGEYPLNVSYYLTDSELGVIPDGYFTDVTVVKGTLTVLPASLTVKTESAVKSYDGTPLTAGASLTGLVGTDTGKAAVTATGTITGAGTAVNTYVIDWGTVNPANYTLTENLGTLKVTANEAAVMLTAASASKTYDGTALTDDTVTAEGLPAGFTVSAVVSGSQTDAGSSANTIVSYTILDSFGSDVTLSFTDVVPVDGTLTVTPATLTVTTGSAAKKYDGTALTKAEVSVAGLVTDETVTVTAAGSQTDVGTSENTYTIVWGTAKAGNYTLTENLGTLEVTANDTLVTFTAESKSKVYDGTVLTAEGVTADGLPSGFTFTASASGSQKDAGSGENTVSSWKIFNADSSNVSAYFTNVTAVSGTLTVTPAPAAVTTGSDSKMYDGTALTKAEASITGLVGSETAAVTATGVIITVGTAENTYSIEWGTAKAGNYTLTESLGILKVTPNDTLITITSGDGYMRYKPYDCVVKNSDYTVEGLPEGFTLTAEITGEQSWAVSSSANTIASYKITNAASEDVTSCFSNVQKAEGTLTVDRAIVTIWSDDSEKTYNGTPLYGGTIHWTGIYGTDNAQHGISITHNIGLTDAGSTEDKFSVYWNYPELESLYETEEYPGTLTVKPAQLTVTTGSASKAYDGTALTKAEASVSGLVTDETVTVTANGSQTDVGTGKNTYSIEWGTAKAGNYTLTENLGTLTVTQNDTPIIFKATSAEKVYDGSALTSSEVTVEGLPSGFTYEATASGAQTDVGTSDNEVASYKILKGETDVTASFSSITTEKGTLKVTPAPATVTTGSASKPYDDTALTNTEASISGLKNGETAAVTATGSQTEVGSSSNTYDITWVTAKEGNYIITNALGTLEVTKNNAEITLTAASASKEYDGNALTNSSVTADGLPAGFTVEATASGSQTDAGESANVVNDGYVIKNASGEDKTANFTNIRKVDGKLTVTKATVTVTTNTASKSYDGTALFGSDASVSGLVSGETVTVNATGSRTDAGTSDNTYAIIWDNAKESNYTVHEELGKLTVEKRQFRASSFFTDDISGEPCREAVYNGKEYYVNIGISAPLGGYSVDHSPLYQHEMDLTVTWALWGDSCTFHATGSARDAGEHSTTCVVEFNSGNPDNYEIEITCDKLKITPAPITVTARSDEKTYDGYPLPEVTDTPMISGSFYGDDYLYAEHTGKPITDVGTEPRGCTYSWGIGSNPDNYSVRVEQGSLTITKRNLIVRSSDAQKPYDGEPLTMHEYSIEGDGLAPDEDITVNFTGSQTEPDSSPNTFTVSWDTAKEGNYNLVPVYGTLTVTEAEGTGFFGMFSLGTKDAKQEDGNETDPTAGITDETGEMGEPPEPDPSADPPDETGDQAAADQQDPPGNGFSDGSGADVSEPDSAADPPGNGDEGEEAGPPTDDPPGNGDEGEEPGEPDPPADDPPGNGDEGEEAGEPDLPADDPPGNGDKGEEAGPPSDDAPESAGNDEKTEPALPADKPENNGGEKETPASDPFAAEPEERNSEPAQVPETSAAEPADIGGSSAPAPVPDVPKTEPAVPDPGD